ncbi:MAG TPA: lytic transglycosylase domain-containing protein [Methylibium sp.]|uniref:lytic transglycosylase domain-containing protein n=1 Tax=Methylibium sp. TaxID=2067992 RepID=UPI002DB64E9C|nr:lytic transglycosylase domain-containing protein [Methylibium sp.]HEU4459579.1 lytic transglycosylase domain-containing protein [Methylibium sp.]
MGAPALRGGFARPRGGVLGAALLMFGATGAQGAEMRWRCTLIDGSVQLLQQNLEPSFRRAVGLCERVQRIASGLARVAPPVAVTLIEAPPPAPPLAPVVASVAVPVAAPVAAPAPAPALARDFVAAMKLSTEQARLAQQLAPIVESASRRHGVDADLLRAVIHVESRHNLRARSPKGAMGLMQIMPATGARYGVAERHRLYDAAVNIDVGARYLADLSRMFPGRPELVMAAYNAGEGAVLRYGRRIPPFAETQSYVVQVKARLAQLRAAATRAQESAPMQAAARPDASRAERW